MLDCVAPLACHILNMFKLQFAISKFGNDKSGVFIQVVHLELRIDVCSVRCIKLSSVRSNFYRQPKHAK